MVAAGLGLLAPFVATDVEFCMGVAAGTTSLRAEPARI